MMNLRISKERRRVDRASLILLWERSRARRRVRPAMSSEMRSTALKRRSSAVRLPCSSHMRALTWRHRGEVGGGIVHKSAELPRPLPVPRKIVNKLVLFQADFSSKLLPGFDDDILLHTMTFSPPFKPWASIFGQYNRDCPLPIGFVKGL